MKLFKESKGYFRKIFVFFLMFIVIPLAVVSIIFFLFFTRELKQTYIEGQENLVHAIISEAEGTIRMAAKSLPQESVIAFFNDQFTGGSGTMTVKVYESSEMDEEKLLELKNSLPSDQFLINGSFLDGQAGYYVILKLTTKELGQDSYLFMLIFFATVIAAVLSVVAYFISRKITKPVTSLYKSALDTRNQEFPENNSVESQDEMGTITAVFEEMNHDMRTSKELINAYSNAAKAYSLILYLEKNIPLSRFLETNEDFKNCENYILCGVKICNDFVASHYLLNLTRLIDSFFGDENIALVSPINQDTIIILVATNEAKDNFDRLIKDLYDMVDPLAKSKYIMAVTNITKDITALPRRSKQFEELIKIGEFYEAYNKLLSRDSLNKLNAKSSQSLVNEYYPRFVSALLENDRLGIELSTDRFFNALYLVDIDQAIDIIKKLLNRIVEEQSLSDRIDPEFKEIFENTTTITQIKSAFSSALIKASSFYEQEVNPEKKLCENVASVLITNYNKDIDMLSIASRFSVSYSYLSRIFKNHMLMTLTDYLNKYRIDKSCELLSDKSEKLESIAIKVGYNNIQSFQRFFKKYKGTTPTLYRKSVLHN
ncbi:MAG: helix-turn-helix domain-containing protein [Lachnospiraceae bacterium]|nr:helix-turn-helix domain-containing protein [Lachnospiraceae bacterium]